MKTPERQAAGIAFPRGYVDASLLLTTQLEEKAREVNLLGVFEPFDAGLWACIVSMMVVSSAVYWFLERDSEDGDLDGSTVHRATEAVYLTWGIPVGAAGFGPKTLAGRVFSFSWSFWCLLVTAAYTATLASAFTVASVSSSPIKDIQGLQESGGSACVVKGGAVQDFLRNRYPSIPRVQVDSEEGLYSAMRAGKCKAAVTYRVYWHQVKSKQDVNGVEGKCRHISPAGSDIVLGEGGFVVKADSGGRNGKCSSLLRDVLDLHFTEMFLDGFIQNEMDLFFAQQADMSPICPSAGPKAQLASDAQTTVNGMAGTFVIHAGLSLVAIMISLLSPCFQDRQRAQLVGRSAGEAYPEQVKRDPIEDIMRVLEEQSNKIELLATHVERVDASCQQIVKRSEREWKQIDESGRERQRHLEEDGDVVMQNASDSFFGRIQTNLVDLSSRLTSPRETTFLRQGEGESGDASNGKGTNGNGQGGRGGLTGQGGWGGLTVVEVEGTKNGAGVWGKLEVGEQGKNGGATDRSDTSSSTAVA